MIESHFAIRLVAQISAGLSPSLEGGVHPARGLSPARLGAPPINEYVVWYARGREDAVKLFSALYRRDPADTDGFPYAELTTGEILPVAAASERRLNLEAFRLFSSNALFSEKPGPNEAVELRGQLFPSGGNSWKIATARVPGLDLIDLFCSPISVRYKSTRTTSLQPENYRALDTDDHPPCDLVLEPYLGLRHYSLCCRAVGPTVDRCRYQPCGHRHCEPAATHRRDVRLEHESQGVAAGLHYKSVPHITLNSIAQNTNLSPIVAKHETILEAKLTTATRVGSLHVASFPTVRRQAEQRVIFLDTLFQW